MKLNTYLFIATTAVALTLSACGDDGDSQASSSAAASTSSKAIVSTTVRTTTRTHAPSTAAEHTSKAKPKPANVAKPAQQAPRQQPAPATTQAPVTTPTPTPAPATTTEAAPVLPSDEPLAATEVIDNLSWAGYDCSGSCTKTVDGVQYTVSVSENQVNLKVQETGEETALHPHFSTIISEVGAALDNREFGDLSWDAIAGWANSNADDSSHSQSSGSWNVSVGYGDAEGARNRNLVISRG